MCRSPAGRGKVFIDGVETDQKPIPKCQEYLRMKSSILSDENLLNSFPDSVYHINDTAKKFNGILQDQKDELDKTEGTVQNNESLVHSVI